MAGKEEQVGGGAVTPQGPNKLILIGGAVLIAILSAGVAMFFAGGSKGEKKAVAATEQKEGGAHGGEGGGEGEGAVASTYPLEPFIVNITDGHDLRYLKLKVEFETSGANAKSELDARQASLRDAVVVILSTKSLQDVQDLKGKNQLKEEILASANKLVAPGTVVKVYFTDFVVQ
jgi:flagellar FliL protein